MKTLFLQLSDIHINEQSIFGSGKIQKMLDALNTLKDIDNCLMILNGDITSTGDNREFGNALSIIQEIRDCLQENFAQDIPVLVVPGNHDLYMKEYMQDFDKIKKAYAENKIEDEFDEQTKLLDNFYVFSDLYDCFKTSKTIDIIDIQFKTTTYRFSLINTAPFSFKESSNIDKGLHYLSSRTINDLKNSCIPDVELNIAIMHHSPEFLNDETKKSLNRLFYDKYSLIFIGHEHDSKGVSQRINNNHYVIMEGSALAGDIKNKNGFTALVYDTHNRNAKGYSFIWEENFYKPENILDEVLPIKTALFKPNDKFYNELQHFEDSERKISDYFVLQDLQCTKICEDEENEPLVANDVEELLKIIFANKKILISGDSKSGKTTLSKVIYTTILQTHKDFVPMLLTRDTLNLRRLDKVIEFAFAEQYSGEKNDFARYLQVDIRKKIVIVDGFDRVAEKYLDSLNALFKENFGTVILIYDSSVEFDFKKQVREILATANIIKIKIKHYNYERRKQLILRTYDTYIKDNDEERRLTTITSINNMINNYIKFFRLNPEFVINFVMQYLNNYNFNFGNNEDLFSVVYENNVKSRLIQSITNKNKVNGIFSVLQEIAFFMHFNKKTYLSFQSILDIVKKYNDDYRQKIDVRDILQSATQAHILFESDEGIRFRDKNLLSYFVALSLNKKYPSGDANEEMAYILHNICFSINGDIILFMSLISNNPRIILLIEEHAKKHFEMQDELDLDRKNIKYLTDTSLKIKSTLPTDDEKKKKDKTLSEYEDIIKEDEVIKLKDEYEYDESEIENFQNQLLKSIKYIELLSKILPSFSHNLKKDHQDELLNAIYKYPNKLLYTGLKEIEDNYNEYIMSALKDVPIVKKEQKLSSININKEENKAKYAIEQLSASLIISIYNLVAISSSSRQTIDILECFDFDANSNYRVMNLLMLEKSGSFERFKDRAISIYDKTNNKLVKSFVRFSVRNYFLNNDVKLSGGGQALIDKFFPDERKKIVNQIAKRRMTQK